MAVSDPPGPDQEGEDGAPRLWIVMRPGWLTCPLVRVRHGWRFDGIIPLASIEFKVQSGASALEPSRAQAALGPKETGPRELIVGFIFDIRQRYMSCKVLALPLHRIWVWKSGQLGLGGSVVT